MLDLYFDFELGDVRFLETQRQLMVSNQNFKIQQTTRPPIHIYVYLHNIHQQRQIQNIIIYIYIYVYPLHSFAAMSMSEF